MTNQTARRHPLHPVNILAFIWDEERRSSVLLIAAAILALLLANLWVADDYFGFLRRVTTIGALTLDIKHWINEGLMTLFFLVVALEVKREFIDGELNTWRRAAFPLAAAVGGMIVPAFIFTWFNPYPPQSAGWGIPMATDIAIAVGVLTLLGRRIPKSLRVFLLSLAIIDDIGSVLVINMFYSKPTNAALLLCAVLISISLAFMRRQQWWPLSFLLAGLGLWYCLVAAGVSGTLTGVILALAMPLAKRRANAKQLQLAESIEDMLIPFTSFVVVPLFVLANAGIRFRDMTSATTEQGLFVFAGVFLGMAIGKPLGIVAAGWIAQTAKIAHKPSGVSWLQLFGAGCIAGIGFTVSLLVTDLAYHADSTLQHAATTGIFGASVTAAGLGILILRSASHRPPAAKQKA